MKLLITILSVIAVLALPASSFAQPAAPYAWTISASATSPFVNTTSPTGGVATYRLWLNCADLPGSLQDGMAAAEFAVVSVGVTHLATTPVNGFLNAGSTTNLLLAVGACPGGPVVAADLLVLSLPGTMSLAPSSTQTKGTVDCSPNPSLWPIDWIGLGVGLPPLGKGPADCAPVSVEEGTWGQIKGLYR
jgi:hypothetical protein